MFYSMTPEQLVVLMQDPKFIICMTALAIWSLIWKGLALWRAGRNYQKAWFVVMLIVNTAGILEILYLFVFSKMKDRNLPANPAK